ncbi:MULTISPECIES: ABC transporter permease [unclassified Amycolatopsis]|uniref:ABC transporter permease n=1 Tax=unclassified Amycolatopsis TaxID=2618356 RepID=UPI0002625991|nr:ABC transporter permease [Amycolatopsis sp. ATCC 39116]
MTALLFTGVALRRLARDRVAMFFIVLLPLVVILIVGATIRGQDSFRIGVVEPGTPLAAGLSRALDTSPALETRTYSDEDPATAALRRNQVDAVLVLPDGFDERLLSGAPVELPLLSTGSAGTTQGAWSAVSAVVADHAALVQAAGFAAERTGTDPARWLPLAGSLAATGDRITVRTESAGGAPDERAGGFTGSAPTMLVLFVFVNTLAAGAAVIETRKLGVYSRSLAAPVRPREIVFGEALGYVVLALGQSALIIGASAALFGVSWGDPVAALLLTGLWAVVGAGAGILSGTLFRTSEQASAIGPAIGIAFGMLGGCMWPLEIVPPALRAVGHVTPHAWAVDAWTTVLSRGGGVADIAGQLAVLAGFAAVLVGAASWRMARKLA